MDMQKIMQKNKYIAEIKCFPYELRHQVVPGLQLNDPVAEVCYLRIAFVASFPPSSH